MKNKFIKSAYSYVSLRCKSYLIPTSLFLLIAACNPLEKSYLEAPTFDQNTVEKLQKTVLINNAQILADKHLLVNRSTSHYSTENPYEPIISLTDDHCHLNANCRYAQNILNFSKAEFPARHDVLNWWENRELAPEKAEVCGLRFTDHNKINYELKTFKNIQALNDSGNFMLTHYFSCGTCSSLNDLAIYGTLDLTKMAKTCSKRLSFNAKKTCMEAIGFSQACADTWAFNGAQTAKVCIKECIKTYGLLNILRGKEQTSPVDKNGDLNACLLCDEMMSGPGFQYSAGRTRRNSGILSEIERPDTQVYQVPHHYFQ